MGACRTLSPGAGARARSRRGEPDRGVGGARGPPAGPAPQAPGPSPRLGAREVRLAAQAPGGGAARARSSRAPRGGARCARGPPLCAARERSGCSRNSASSSAPPPTRRSRYAGARREAGFGSATLWSAGGPRARPERGSREGRRVRAGRSSVEDPRPGAATASPPGSQGQRSAYFPERRVRFVTCLPGRGRVRRPPGS